VTVYQDSSSWTVGDERNMGNIEGDMEGDMEGDISPFGLYEKKYCIKCQDYRGCLGLIDNMTMELQDSSISTGNSGLDNMVKSMGGITFSSRFKMILDCARLRDVVYNSDI